MATPPEELIADLLAAGVDKACEEIGLDFDAVFAVGFRDKTSSPYAEYEWIVMPHSLVDKGRVIHTIPPVSKCDDMAWEEWFLLNDKLHHNVLYTKKRELCTGEFHGAPDDEDHPRKVLGQRWHYYTDPDLTPLRFRK